MSLPDIDYWVGYAFGLAVGTGSSWLRWGRPLSRIRRGFRCYEQLTSPTDASEERRAELERRRAQVTADAQRGRLTPGQRLTLGRRP